MAEVLIFGKEDIFHGKSFQPGWNRNREVVVTDNVDKAKRHLVLESFLFIIIDLEAGEKKGIELAGFIRQIPRQYLTPIFFLAKDQSREYYAFHEIHCYDYFVKPLKEEEIRKILFFCRKRLEGCEKKGSIVFSIGRDRYPVNPEDILYLESINRMVVVHTVHDELQVPSLRLRDFVQNNGGDFLRIHRGTVVNRNRIQCVDSVNSLVELDNDRIQLKIGRTYLDSVRKAFDENHG
ncbi:MAG: response regulator transcription factor [Eubacterium sp.]|nr:response regulator transcription factor [Eubacterium sp.]